MHLDGEEGDMRLRSGVGVARWKAELAEHLRVSVAGKSKPNYDMAIRDAGRRLGAKVGLALDSHWKTDRVGRGPVRIVDMFSGCGGMSAGYRAVNGVLPAFELSGAVDIDTTANKSYARNLGIAPAMEDIASLARSPKRIQRFADASGIERGRPWVLIGCAPCQGFSSHRNEKGSSDVRNSLFTDFAKIAASLSPDAVVVENVPELLTTKFWPYVNEARKIMSRAGYYVHVAVHNFAQFGVPQARFRALFLAMKRPFVPPSGFLQPSQFRTVRDAIGKLPKVRAGERDADDPMHYSAGHKQSTVETIRAVPKNGGNRPSHIGPDCLRRAAIRNGKPAYEDVYGRLHWDRPSITITAYSRNPASGRFVHPEQDRGLTVREAALLQSFPTNFQFEGSLDACFRQIGNAVSPTFSAYLAGYVLGEILDEPIPLSKFDEGIMGPVAESFSRMIPSIKARLRH